MTKTIKLTAKRQATFPAEVCARLGIGPGDEIDLIPQIENGEQVWKLRKHAASARPWLGSLREFAADATDHSMEAVRMSIERGRAPEE